MAEPGPRRGPASAGARPSGQLGGRPVPLELAALQGPVWRFFDSVGWDERVRSDSREYLEPLVAALDRLQARLGRILDIGTGTGAAALELADRYPDAEVVGMNVSVGMVAQAGARAADAPTNPNTPPCSMVLQRGRGISTSTSS